MDIKIIYKKKAPLLSRTDYEIECTFDKSTPSKEEIKNKVAETLKSDKELVLIKKILNNFGERSVKIIAYVYNNKKDMLLIEPKLKKKEENKPKETAEKAEPKPKEEKK
jgi:small subunit ribosomal protein S24e